MTTTPQIKATRAKKVAPATSTVTADETQSAGNDETASKTEGSDEENKITGTETAAAPPEPDTTAVTANNAPTTIDPYCPETAIITLSISLLPPTGQTAEHLETDLWSRQVLCSVRSQGNFPVFSAPIDGSALTGLPAPILELLEQYRTTILPQNRAKAETRTAAFKTRALTKRGSKETRPGHISSQGKAANPNNQTAKTKVQMKLTF